MWIAIGYIVSYFKRTLILLLFSWMVLVHTKLPKPKLYGKSIPHRDLDTRYGNTKKKIVLIHNFYRARVNPPAKNMLEMTWYKAAQDTAQKWASSCQFLIHDKPLKRWTEDYGSCGQNVFISNVEVDWMFVAKAWYMEHQNFTYGSYDNNLQAVSHYTQMVWYNSHRIGCGFKYCGRNLVSRPFFNYVCNYCPIGNNPKRIGTPYADGKPCDKCPGHCKYKRLCTNSCPQADLWANCADLNTTWHGWLCGETGVGNRGCPATCTCSHAIT